MADDTKNCKIISPISGKIIPLDQVPDPVFADKVLGDGVAVLPSEGKIYSPVNGEVSSIAETKHAYGFQSDDGIDVLVHFGLETVALKGEGFTPKVNVGDKVKIGDLIAEVDIDFLNSKNINLVTPVLVCDGVDDKKLNFNYGDVIAKKDTAIDITSADAPQKQEESPKATIQEKPKEEPVKKQKNSTESSDKGKKKEKSKKTSGVFGFLQKFSKALMVVVAIMPAAGLSISIGKLIQMTGTNSSVVFGFGGFVEQIGWAIINNLAILFAVAIGGAWAKERAGGAFAGLLSFIVVNVLTGKIFGITSTIYTTEGTTFIDLFGNERLVSSYFTEVLGAPALNMGVFVGIVCGFVGAMTFNKYYNYNKLPDTLAFFNGKRFVPIVILFRSAVVAFIFAIIWPAVQGAINEFGTWLATSRETAPIISPFLYGCLERLLLPFGLHHMLTIPICYTSLGGEYQVLTGVNAGQTVYGQETLWFAWATDLSNLKNTDPQQYEYLLHAYTPGRFKAGQIIGSTGTLIGLAFAMYRRVDVPPAQKKKYFSIFFATTAAAFLTGVTEQVEFLFMFAAIPLYVVYAVVQGLAFAMADILPMITGGAVNLRIYGFGFIDFVSKIPLTLSAGLGVDLIAFFACCIVFAVLMFFIAFFMIKAFKLATPGRLGNYQALTEEAGAGADDSSMQVAQTSGSAGDSQAERIIALLGGRSNIEEVDACMTRLRITVKDSEKVADASEWKKEGALNLLVKGNGIQAVYGPKADVLKSDINDVL